MIGADPQQDRAQQREVGQGVNITGTGGVFTPASIPAPVVADLHPAPVSADQPKELRGAFFLGGQAADIGALFAALDPGAFYYGGFVH